MARESAATETARLEARVASTETRCVPAVAVRAAVPVLDDDSDDTLAARVLAQDHRLYPQAVAWFCAERLRITENGSVELAEAGRPTDALVVPVST
jgi:hypothetical protein